MKIHPDVIAIIIAIKDKIITNITVERIEIIKLPWEKKAKDSYKENNTKIITKIIVIIA